MQAENEMLIKEIVDTVRKLSRAVHMDPSGMSKEFGLTDTQSGVLRMLAQSGPISSAQLSRKLFVTPSNMTGIIDRLEKKKLVERIRKTGDRRVALISLTEEGNSISPFLPDPIEKKLIKGLADLEPEKVRCLLASLEHILHLIGTENGNCTQTALPDTADAHKDT
ncbi:MAG: MarR family transcriptional regulator [Desulfococcaceae bacterium]|jgi:DNA-binding MarR family transcriptional regulator|nr:MarR family transcriptional regulator [Desulfococcaceae bacterium]